MDIDVSSSDLPLRESQTPAQLGISTQKADSDASCTDALTSSERVIDGGAAWEGFGDLCFDLPNSVNLVGFHWCV